jgi:hypothetical protein
MRSSSQLSVIGFVTAASLTPPHVQNTHILYPCLTPPTTYISRTPLQHHSTPNNPTANTLETPPPTHPHHTFTMSDWDQVTKIGKSVRGPGADRETTVKGKSALNAAQRSGAILSTDKKFATANVSLKPNLL